MNASSKNKATSMVKILSSRPVVKFAHFAWDVLVVLQKLSLALQVRNATVHDLFVDLKSARAGIDKLQTK